MEPLTPVDTAELFPSLHAELIGLLRGLPWRRLGASHGRRVVARPWCCGASAGHRSAQAFGGRDGYRSSAPGSSSFIDVVDFINKHNEEDDEDVLW